MSKTLSKKVFVAGAAIAGATIAAFLLASSYYKNHFFDNTYINDVDCSGYTVGDTLRELSLSSKGQTLKLVEKDGTVETINCRDFGYKTSAEEELNAILKKQNPYLWFKSLNVFGGKESNNYLNLDVEYDKDGLSLAVDSLEAVITGTQPSTNATIKKGTDGYYIEKEVIGNIVDKDKLVSVIEKNLKSGNLTINLLESNCYVLPEITSDNPNLASSLQKIAVVENASITYDFKDRKEVVDKSKIKDWITLDNEGNITLDESAVSLYVSQLAYKYDTYLTDRQFVTAAGNEITVGGGIYGWQIHKTKETEALTNLILSGAVTEREPEYFIKGYERGEDDIGKTYIEIDLTTQHLWYFKNGEVFLESDIVSGYPYNGHSTPTGVFCVWSREKDRQLVGETYDTHVDYWMPINWDGVGLHDAWWQTSFGGTVYQTKYGSHGCINLPTDIAAKIYENVAVGTPVIIYES